MDGFLDLDCKLVATTLVCLRFEWLTSLIILFVRAVTGTTTTVADEHSTDKFYKYFLQIINANYRQKSAFKAVGERPSKTRMPKSSMANKSLKADYDIRVL